MWWSQVADFRYNFNLSAKNCCHKNLYLLELVMAQVISIVDHAFITARIRRMGKVMFSLCPHLGGGGVRSVSWRGGGGQVQLGGGLGPGGVRSVSWLGGSGPAGGGGVRSSWRGGSGPAGGVRSSQRGGGVSQRGRGGQHHAGGLSCCSYSLCYSWRSDIPPLQIKDRWTDFKKVELLPSDGHLKNYFTIEFKCKPKIIQNILLDKLSRIMWANWAI